MKKVIMLILCVCFVLCGCSEKVEQTELEIPFQKIAAANSRDRLLEKYDCVTENFKLAGDVENSYWVSYYEKNGERINAIVDYSEEYKCYYYNEQVYVNYGDGNYRTVIPYRENYDDIINRDLTRSDTLNYVYILESRAEETDTGYIASYEFTVNNDILPEFESYGVSFGDRLCIEYELNKDFIIQNCRYYIVLEKGRKTIALVENVYNEKKSFPEELIKWDEKEKVQIKIIENFGTGAEHTETFKVNKGSYIAENEVLFKYYLFKDPYYRDYFDSITEIINKDTDIFVIDVVYADMIQAREEYMEGYEEGEEAPEDEQQTE